MLDRQFLAILREVNRMGSVTAAAERLNVTQSALSHTVRRIEEQYQVKIWIKQGRGLRFTQAGEYLLDLAERLLPQLDLGERVLADFAIGRRGLLRVGMECHPCQRWLMRKTTQYLSAWPDVDFNVRTAFRFDGVAALLGHEIDLLVTPDPVNMPDLIFVPAIDYDLVLVVHEEHPLAGRNWISPQDLQDEVLITVPVGIERLDIFTQFLIPAQCRPKRHRTAETTDLMLRLVAANRGVSVLPDWLVREEGADLPIRTVQLGKRGIRKSINLGVRKGEESVAYIAGFLELAKD
ncbi:LysR family transcriptional regulator [Pandoraea terrae]|uniref:LysR family transcriptional regulator n=1 Tax=Pandoraea terrae TaxID=1537710 RepID=A0A5E4VAK1_9BURK|nr:LysR family transcriptional regulator [Pandoraea terrae]VVE09287.1 LysR family transcriptional regulator [Pandoraea terrae]